MNTNYYEILGVSPTSDIADLKRAYRLRAREFHPDCGGTHIQMVLLNEAWEILSNPETRKRYNEFLANSNNLELQKEVNTDSRKARSKAEEYPKKWSEFEKWLSSILNDFSYAEYQENRIDLSFLSPLLNPYSFSSSSVDFTDIPYLFPRNSISALVFFFVGGLLGLISVPFLFMFLWHRNAIRRWTLPILILPILLGPLIGLGIHYLAVQIVKKTVQLSSSDSYKNAKTREKTSTQEEHITIVCKKCNQKLRLPKTSRKLMVTCPTCKHKFLFELNKNPS